MMKKLYPSARLSTIASLKKRKIIIRCSECTMIAVQYLILEDKMPSGEAQKILDAFWTRLE